MDKILKQESTAAKRPMYLSKLTTLLKSFKPVAFGRLNKYVHSAYFNVYSPSVALLHYLAPLYPRFEREKISIKRIAKGSKSLSTRIKQETAGSRLMNAIDEFIAEEEWLKNKTAKSLYRLKGYKQRDLIEKFDRDYKKELSFLNENEEQDIDTFFHRHLLAELSLNGFEAKLNRSSHNDIMPVVETLDAFYAIKKLRYLCEAINRKIVLGVEYREEHIPLLLKILEPYNIPKYPYTYLFVNVYKMLASENYEDFDLYYKLIKQFSLRNKPTPTIGEATSYAINQCLYWNNKGMMKAGNEYLWGIEWRMKNKLLFENGKLIPVIFRNIISIAAINRKRPEFLERLIVTYSPYLPEEHSDTFLAFANGLHRLAMRKYKEAGCFFIMAQAKEDVKFNCVIRRWQWICLYEGGPNATDILFNHLDSFKRHLKRNKKELKPVAAAFELFIDYAMKLHQPASHELTEDHQHLLQGEEHFPGKQWLEAQFVIKHKKTRAQSARVKA